MLWQRVVTAALGIPAIFLIFYFAGWPLIIASSLVIIVGLFEFYRLAGFMGLKPLTGWGYIIGLSCPLFGIYLWHGHYFSHALWLIIVFSLAHFILSFPNWNLNDLGVTYFGAFYVGGLFSYLIRVRETVPDGWIWVLLIFLLTWANDTAAYFIGSQLGKHRLCSKLSPKKSIEGFIGGLLFTIVIALMFGHLASANHYIAWAFLGCLAATVGTIGDLLESALKRLGQAKDSGTLIPGHGGILDRLDSLLLVAPLVYYYIQMFRL